MRGSLPIVNKLAAAFTICTNGQTDSALSQLVSLLMRCSLLVVIGSTTLFTICTNATKGKTDSALSQFVSLLMRCNLPVVNGSTTPFTICTNGTDREAAFTTFTICANGTVCDAAFANGVCSCVLDIRGGL